MTTEPEGEEGLDVAAALRNVVLLLQKNPEQYRFFGVYWWPLKQVLKRVGYGEDQLRVLGGTYQDPETSARVPPLTLQPMLREAFATFSNNVQFPHPNNMVETPDGEMVRIWDNDAGI